MSQNLVYVLDNDQGLFSNAVRMFFAGIIRFLYAWISNFIDIMYHIAENVEFNVYAERIADRLFNILIIFMVFRLTISLLSYIVDPDSFSDKSKGAAGLIKRVLIAVVVLVAINPIFELMGKIQSELINNGIIENLLMGSENDSVWYSDDGRKVYFTEISPICETLGDEHKENLKVATTSSGNHLALLTLKPFIQPIPESEGDYSERKDVLYKKGYCGVDINNAQYVDASDSSLELSFGAMHNTSDYLQWDIYNGVTGDWSPENNVYLIDFNYFFALIVGIIVCLILISFCFDVVIRALTLILLKVIAPISAISYISPKGKSSEMLGMWGKKLFATWASLFIRILALSLALSIISVLCETGNIGNDNAGMLEQLIIIIGALMFAKKLPHLLEELIPGLKLGGGFELNPFKRISKEALGGNLLLGAGAAIGGAALSGVSNLATGVEKNFSGGNTHGLGWNKGAKIKENLKNNLSSMASSMGYLAKGSAKTAGSVVAGAGSAGFRSFLKTSKNGDIIGGIKQGHGEAQFAKMQRADLERKGSTMFGRVAADANRFIGRENKAQRLNREILESENALKAEKTNLDSRKNLIVEEKTRLQNERDDKAKDFSKLKTQIEAFKSRLDNKGEVYLKDKNGNFVYEMDANGNYVMENGERKRVKVKIKDELDNLESMKNTDYSMEVASRHENIKNIYQPQIDATTDMTLKSLLQSKMNQEMSAITVDSVKQEHIKEQNDKINKMRDDYTVGVQDGTYTDEVATQIMANIESIRQNNSEVAKIDIYTRDDAGNAVGYNRGAVYSADDQIKIISNEYDNKIQVQEEKLYQINIEEQNIAARQRDIEKRKTDDDYIRAMADNAAQKVTSPQPENWLSSPNIESSSGYGGYQLHSKSGGTGPGGGPPPGGRPRP